MLLSLLRNSLLYIREDLVVDLSHSLPWLFMNELLSFGSIVATRSVRLFADVTELSLSITLSNPGVSGNLDSEYELTLTFLALQVLHLPFWLIADMALLELQ